MKKRIVAIICLVMMLVLVSCTGEAISQDAVGSTTTGKLTAQESPQMTSQKPTASIEPKPLDSDSQTAMPPLTIVESMDDYTALLYENAVGGGGNTNTLQYTGKKFNQSVEFKKENIAKKTERLFEIDYQFHYSDSVNMDNCSYEIDRYDSAYNGRGVFASYRMDTGKLVRYKTNAPCVNRNYVSPVNPHSTEAEFVAYAKQILMEKAGVSAEDWEVKVTTWRDEYGNYDGFLNYSHENPEYNAEYTFTFYKTIGGVERGDKMVVKMTNVGEVFEFNAINYEEAFAPFENAKIDKEKLEAAVWRAYSPIGSGYMVSGSKIVSNELTVVDDELWAQVTIEYKMINGEITLKSGVIYAIKVAELQ